MRIGMGVDIYAYRAVSCFPGVVGPFTIEKDPLRCLDRSVCGIFAGRVFVLEDSGRMALAPGPAAFLRSAGFDPGYNTLQKP